VFQNAFVFGLESWNFQIFPTKEIQVIFFGALRPRWFKPTEMGKQKRTTTIHVVHPGQVVFAYKSFIL